MSTTVGIDIGSRTAKAVVLREGEILSSAIIFTEPESVAMAHKILQKVLNGTGLTAAQIDHVVGTGYGRLRIPFANSIVTEISCHAKGANWFFPGVRTVLDMGGQDCKAMSCSPTGIPQSFIMNEKCAAGTGRFLEYAAEALGVRLEDIGKLSLDTIEGASRISSFCAVYARREVINLSLEGKAKNDILAGICDATVGRIIPLIKRVGLNPDFAITGGIAKNIGIVRRLEEKLGLEAKIPFESQIVGALGAAIFAREFLEGKASTNFERTERPGNESSPKSQSAPQKA